MKKDMIIFGAGIFFLLLSSLVTFLFYQDLTNKRYELGQLLQEYRVLSLEYNRLISEYEAYEREIAEVHIHEPRGPRYRANYYFILPGGKTTEGEKGFPQVAQRITPAPR